MTCSSACNFSFILICPNKKPGKDETRKDYLSSAVKSTVEHSLGKDKESSLTYYYLHRTKLRAKENLEKHLVSIPALIRSASTSFGDGYGPCQIKPISQLEVFH